MGRVGSALGIMGVGAALGCSGVARTLVGRGILLRLLQQAQLLLDRLDRRLALLHDIRVLGRLQLALELLPIQCGALGTGGTPLQQQVRLYSQT